MVSLLGNSYSAGRGPLSQNQFQAGNNHLSSTALLSELNHGHSFHMNDFPQLTGHLSSAGGSQRQLVHVHFQVHKELQDALSQMDAIHHEMRTISFMNPGPLTRTLTDNDGQTLTKGNTDLENLSDDKQTIDTSKVYSTTILVVFPSSDMHRQDTAYARLAESAVMRTKPTSNKVISELSDESGLTVLPVSAEDTRLLPIRKGSCITQSLVIREQIISSMAMGNLVNGGNIGRNLSSGGLNMPGVASRLNLTDANRSGGLDDGVTRPIRLAKRIQSSLLSISRSFNGQCQSGSPPRNVRLSYMKSGGATAVTVNPSKISNSNMVYVDDVESLSFTPPPPLPCRHHSLGTTFIPKMEALGHYSDAFSYYYAGGLACRQNDVSDTSLSTRSWLFLPRIREEIDHRRLPQEIGKSG
ncbi:hypothetical protein L6452_19320 [Arctium lappa]|uniref:Uncharacterized protein n=1 Tax=Arctium lappa TaxID=4217 RepID=A0ACB9B937_ARCLA|nr:hypothetical protein L6452_19320 [Arctium lappa]